MGGVSYTANSMRLHLATWPPEKQIEQVVVQRLAQDKGTNLHLTADTSSYGAKGEHLCMMMRGIRTPGQMISSVMRGCFFENPQARLEFLGLIK